MKKRLFMLVVLIFIFTSGRVVFAHEGGKMSAPSTSHLNGGSQSGHDMDGMDMTDSGGDMEGMNMDGMNHSQGPIADTPPNVMVLGTFGAINLFFLFIGIWNKWFRRKGEFYGNAK